MMKCVKSKTGDVENRLCQLILRRSLPEGAQVPSETMICENYHVSRITARRAIANLVSKGVLYTEHGRGSFVKSFAQTQKIYGGDELSHTIGLFMPRDSYFLSAVYGVEDVVKNAGFRIFVSSFPGHFQVHAEEILRYTASGMDGAIIDTPESSPYPQAYMELFRKLKNVVIFNSPAPSPEIASVFSDDVEGMIQVMRYLFSLGHRRIAFFGGETTVAATRDRLSGYRQALMEHGEAEPEILIECKEYITDDASRKMKEFLESGAVLPTAFVCATDQLASSACRCLLEHGFRIPEDVSVTGYGNVVDIAYRLTPALTSVDQHPQEQGRLAGELLLKQIFKQEIPKRQLKIIPTLHIKNSCTVPKQK